MILFDFYGSFPMNFCFLDPGCQNDMNLTGSGSTALSPRVQYGVWPQVEGIICPHCANVFSKKCTLNRHIEQVRSLKVGCYQMGPV